MGRPLNRVAVALVLALAGPAAAQFSVYVQPAGSQYSQQTTTAGQSLAVNTFDAIPVGGYGTLGPTTLVGGQAASTLGVTSGTYTASTAGTGTQFGVFAPDLYGGSGGFTGSATGTRYFAAGQRAAPGGASPLSPSVTLQLSQTAYYFGLFWTAVDSSNRLDFYNGSTLVGSVTADQLLGSTALAGNPAYNGPDGEKWVFVNTYLTKASGGFDRVVLSNGTSGTGFESDSHTIGYATPAALDFTPVGEVLVPVPEPAGLLAVAGGLLVARRFRRG